MTVYPIAGRQLFLRVPDRLCEECDLTIKIVRQVVRELGNRPQIQVRIRPWLNYLPQALWHGGWHPPVVTINGKRFSQGTVPDEDRLRQVIGQNLIQKEATA
ncbi:MAG: hypothetical protein HY330_05110 [Chloroflexi bacterium]|nr:hypothetical protein [Chloroflexota bacterium]